MKPQRPLRYGSQYFGLQHDATGSAYKMIWLCIAIASCHRNRTYFYSCIACMHLYALLIALCRRQKYCEPALSSLPWKLWIITMECGWSQWNVVGHSGMWSVTVECGQSQWTHFCYTFLQLFFLFF